MEGIEEGEKKERERRQEPTDHSKTSVILCQSPGRILTRDDIFQVPRNQAHLCSPLSSPSTDNVERNIYARTLECFFKALYG